MNFAGFSQGVPPLLRWNGMAGGWLEVGKSPSPGSVRL